MPEAILEKEGPLDEAETAMLHRHPLEAKADGLTIDSIPLGSRIIAVAVAYAALTSNRPYREALTSGEALAELRRCAGAQFDPQVVEALAADLAEEAAPASERVSVVS